MVVRCEILLKNKEKSFYKPGQLVEGTVKYDISEPTKFSSITLSLRGKGKCYWVPLGSFTRIIYKGSEDYVDQHIDILQAKQNKTAIVEAGTYEKQFTFTLPVEIPSTYKDGTCSIAYFIVLKFVKANVLGISERFELEIKVQGSMEPNLATPMTYETKHTFFLSQKTISLKAEIETTFLYAGEYIKLTLKTENHSEVSIIAMNTTLIKYITYKSNCNNEKQTSKIVNGIEMKLTGSARIKTEIEKTEQIETTSELMASMHSNILTIEYRVKVAIKLPFPFKELCLEIPVIIAAKINDVNEDKFDDQPPSYWQAMNFKNIMEKEA